MNKVKLSYIFLFLTTFLFTLLVSGPMPYFLFYVCILSFLVPFIHLILVFIGIKANIKLPDDFLYQGDEICVEYNIKNNNILSIPFLKFSSSTSKLLGDGLEKSELLSLSPFEKFKLKEKVILKRRGFYNTADLKITISDIFYIFKFKKNFKSKVNLLVYPNITEIESFKTYSNKNLGEILVQESIFQDISSISSIKEYSEGNSINQIHWKLSAKRDTPMIKIFETVSSTGINIFIDNYKPLFKEDIDRRLEDKAVDTSLAIVNYFLNLGINLSLYTFSGRDRLEIVNRKKNDLKLFLEAFARFKADGEYSIKSVIEEKLYTIADSSAVIIITPNLDKEMAAMAIKLKMKNLFPIFIVVSDKQNNISKVDLVMQKRLTEENIELHFIDCNTNIKEELEIKNG